MAKDSWFPRLRGTFLSLFNIGKAQINSSSLTVARTYNLPDQSGILALTSQLVGSSNPLVTRLNMGVNLFTDNFSTDPVARLTSVDGPDYVWASESVRLSHSGAGNGNIKRYTIESRSSDQVSISADITLISDESNLKHYGLWFLQAGSVTGYRFAYFRTGGQDKVNFHYLSYSNYNVLKEVVVSVPVPLGTLARFRFDFNFSTNLLRGFIDGVEVISHVDAARSLSPLFAGLWTYQSVSDFDNVAISGISWTLQNIPANKAIRFQNVRNTYVAGTNATFFRSGYAQIETLEGIVLEQFWGGVGDIWTF